MSLERACRRVRVLEWLTEVEGLDGPLPPVLRHTVLTLARYMDGEGEGGCYPSSRHLAVRMGVHRATVSRWVKRLHELGWLDIERRRGRYGRSAFRYYPAVPLARVDAPIEVRIGALKCANQDAIGARVGEIGAPGCASLSYREEGAAPPSPAEAGSAAPDEESERNRKLRDEVRYRRSLGYSNDKIINIISKWFHPPATVEEIEAIR